MKPSKVMDELYKIKEECSLHLASLTPEERSGEFRQAVDWYEKTSGKPVKTVDYSCSGKAGKKEPARV
jgi:hypothetical protein